MFAMSTAWVIVITTTSENTEGGILYILQGSSKGGNILSYPALQLSSYAVNLRNSIIQPLHTTNQLQWCGVFGERHEESHTAMRYNAIPVVCPKYTTVGGGARNHLYYIGGDNPQRWFSSIIFIVGGLISWPH